MNVISFVVDTNIFHECQSLDAVEFPWSDIGNFDVIELIVTDPVLSELDRQKKDTRARIKRRAVEAVAWIRGILQSGADEHVFRQSEPRVVMRVSAQAPSSGHSNVLDLNIDDDRIVGVALALIEESPDRDIHVLSDDTRPIAKSKALGIPFKFIPPSWGRVAAADEQQKEIDRLKAEIATLRATHPQISVYVDSAGDKRITLSRNAFLSPSEEETNSLRATLLKKVTLDKIAEAFPPYRQGRMFELLRAQRGMEFVLPGEDTIERYNSIVYPAWIEEFLSYLASLPKIFNSGTSYEEATICLGNSGFRPAEDVRILFVARGPFALLPGGENEYLPEFPEVPAVPHPPRGEWRKDGVPVAEVTQTATGRFGQGSFAPEFYPRTTSRRDDEDWYFEPSVPEKPVNSFELVCRRFRHGKSVEKFQLRIFDESETSTKSGALEVEVSASNLGRAVTEVFPVTLKTNFVSPLSMLEGVVEKTDFFKGREKI